MVMMPRLRESKEYIYRLREGEKIKLTRINEADKNKIYKIDHEEKALKYLSGKIFLKFITNS